jgi:hypothetical protein
LASTCTQLSCSTESCGTGMGCAMPPLHLRAGWVKTQDTCELRLNSTAWNRDHGGTWPGLYMYCRSLTCSCLMGFHLDTENPVYVFFCIRTRARPWRKQIVDRSSL